MNRQIFLTLLIVFLLGGGCSSISQPPPSSSFAFVPMKSIQWKGRSPAFFFSQGGSSFLSDKNLYFQTLAQQFQKLSKIASSPLSLKPLSHCPSFHSSFLTIEFNPSPPAVELSKRNALFSLTKDEYLLRSLFLEINLPLKRGATHPLVYDAIKNGTPYNRAVQQGLRTHLDQTYQELQELCQYGYSQNYYLYQNMIKHTEQKPLPRNTPDSLRTLLKVSVLANYSLLHSLSLHPRPSSLEQEIFTRLHTLWAFRYFSDLKHRQNKLLFFPGIAEGK